MTHTQHKGTDDAIKKQMMKISYFPSLDIKDTARSESSKILKRMLLKYPLQN